MLPHFIAPIQNERKAGERPAGPHRLALAAAAAPPVLGDGASTPRSPSSRLAAAATSPRLAPGGVNGSSRAAALPAFRSLLRGRAAPFAAATPRQLPHVRHPVEPAPPAYTSLDFLRKLTELHKGKHSTVHSYVDSRTGQLVAVKAYHKRTMAKRHFRNVRREVAIGRLLARQRFTGTVLLLGAFEDDNHIYLVQESCQGGDLYCRMMRAPSRTLLEADVCRDVVVPLLLTLTFLHANHIVHRDIKPENLFFTADGGLRLGDFGLSIDAHKERPTSRVGTLDYMAPEVVGMLSPDEIQQRGLAPHQIGHYDCKVDVWAVGILTYELICGRPPFEVECLKQTERNIKYLEVDFPPHVSLPCRSFIRQALTKRPESRPSAAQLFQHSWVQAHYQHLLAGQQQHRHHQHRQIAVAAAQAAASMAHTPELRRTVSQPPSPSKSMPEDAAAGSRQAGSSGTSTPSAAAGLAPFLPLSQAKMAHKVRLLSPGRPPNSSRAAGWRRRRLSDPLARMPELPAAAHAEEAVTASAAAAAAAADEQAPPRTPEAAYALAAVSDGTGAAAAAAGGEDTASNSMAQRFETPGTPGLKTTPLGRQRPAVLQARRGPLGRSPFLLATTAGSSSGSGGANTAAGGDFLPQLGPRKAGSPKRSRFVAAATAAAAAAAAENDEVHAAEALGSPDVLGSRSSSLSSLALAKDGSSDSLHLAVRSCSFTSFGGGSSGNLQLAARATSFTSFGGSSSSNLSNIMGSRPPSRQQLEGMDQQQNQLAGGASGAAVETAPLAAAGALQQQLQLLQL